MRIYSLREFDKIAAPIVDWEFDGVDGLEPDTISGFFYSDRYDELVDFCRKNSDFHVISLKNYIYYNRPIPGATLFRLGQGGADPSMFFVLGGRHEKWETSDLGNDPT